MNKKSLTINKELVPTLEKRSKRNFRLFINIARIKERPAIE
jgi:hypothetical protein